MADNIKSVYLPKDITKIIKIEYKDDELIRFLRNMLNKTQELENLVNNLTTEIEDLKEKVNNLA